MTMKMLLKKIIFGTGEMMTQQLRVFATRPDNQSVVSEIQVVEGRTNSGTSVCVYMHVCVYIY